VLSRLFKTALVVACVLPAQCAIAQAVMLQQFGQQNKTENFALANVPQSPAIESAITPQDLATDFASIGADEDQTTSNPADRLGQGERSRDRGLNHQWPAAPLSGCATEAYRPDSSLPARVERRRATWYATMAAAACEAGIPVNLLDAVVIAESRYDPSALSLKGAAGLAQLMPDIARRLGVTNVWDPIANLRGGAHMLRALLDEFGRFDLALAAYNAGAGRVRPKRQVPRIPETVRYVSEILITMRNQFLIRTRNMP